MGPSTRRGEPSYLKRNAIFFKKKTSTKKVLQWPATSLDLSPSENAWRVGAYKDDVEKKNPKKTWTWNKKSRFSFINRWWIRYLHDSSVTSKHVEKWLNDFLQYQKQFLKLDIHLFSLFCVYSFREKIRMLGVSFFEPSYTSDLQMQLSNKIPLCFVGLI